MYNEENGEKQNNRNYKTNKEQSDEELSNSETQFTNCFKEKFRVQLKSQVNCSTPYFDDFLGEKQLEECKTKEVINIPN